MSSLEPRLKTVSQDIIDNAVFLDNNYYLPKEYIEPAVYSLQRANEDWGEDDEKIDEAFTVSPVYKIAKAMNELISKGFTQKVKPTELYTLYHWDVKLEYVFFSKEVFDEFCAQVQVL